MSDRTPPTRDDLLDLLSRTLAPSYWEQVLSDPGGMLALYRGMAEIYASLARRAHKMAVSGYFLPYGDETESPATFGRRSTSTVTLRRASDSWRGITMGVGTVVLAGPQGRNYLNATEIVWEPFGATEQEVTFEAEYEGWTWDLPFLADADGLVTLPGSDPPVLWSSQIDLRDEEVRSGSRGSIVVEAGGRVVYLEDIGGGDVLNAADVGRYVMLTSAVEVANRRRVLRIVSFIKATTDDPPGSGLRPGRARLDVTEPVVLQAAIADDGAVLTQETGGPYTLLPAVPAVGDAFYFGVHAPFVRLDLTIATGAEGDHEVVWEYWDGAAWASLGSTLVDGTVAFRQSGRVQWSEPAGWATTAVDGVTAYLVRARVSVVTAATGASGTAIVAGLPFGLVAEAGTVSWSVLRWQDLGFVLRQLTAPAGGRDNTLGMLGDERKVYPQRNESEEAFRQRASRLAEAVSPLAIQGAVNSVLAPLGFRGRVLDRQTDGEGNPPGFQGFYADLDPALAPEWLGAADLSAEDAGTMVPIAKWQSTRHFWVYLPPLGYGFFGIVADAYPDPQMTLDDGSWIVSAADVGFSDGFAIDAESIYAQVYEAVRPVKLHGVSFTMDLDPDLLTPC